MGVTLALVIGILWVSKHKNQRTITGLSVFPTIFNTSVPILFGARIFLNPIYFLPIINMLIASALIYVHLIPSVVYPIPTGTPGILTPFVGTGGNWGSLLVSVLLVILDTAIYITFIKIALKIDEKLEEERENEDK